MRKITLENIFNRKNRDKTGWTLEEIKENARKELEEFKKISKDEPDDLVSGDMDKIIRDDNEDQHTG